MSNNSLIYPQWIDWTPTNDDSKGTYPFSTGYRRITNLYGGEPGSNNLKWLSRFHTGQNTNNQGTYYAPIWEENPDYVWFLDEKNKKFKFSDANNPKTYSVNPVQSCLSSRSGYTNCDRNCCDKSSYTEDGNCLYSWKYGNSASGSKMNCSEGNAFYQKNASCDRWSYYDKPNIINSDLYGCDGQDTVGTFCNHLHNQNPRMKTYLGCDCNSRDGGSCSNMSGKSCSSSSTDYDDYQICQSNNPEAERAEWKFIDDTATVACCSLPKEQIDGYEQCKYQFNPSASSNKCSEVMQDFCVGHWGYSTQTGQACNNFLGNSPMNRLVTQQVLQNYITSRYPQDYISRPLAQKGNSLSLQYYTDNKCDINEKPSDCDTNPDQPCCRDDSDNPDNFFSQTVPYMCNYYFNNNAGTNTDNMQGVCDAQLQYFCQEFSREDLAADITLQNVCGCFLLTTGPVDSPNVSGTNENMSMTAPPQDTSPYYNEANDPAGANCDVLCDTSQIQSISLGGPCTQPVCIIDDVTINQVNSNSGDIKFEQNCGGGTCYISNVTINETSSSTGAITLSQDCKTCYTFDGNNINNANQVYCDTLQPIDPYNPPPPPIKGKDWFQKYKYYIIIFTLLFGLFLFWIFIINKKNNKSSDLSDTGSFYDYWSYY